VSARFERTQAPGRRPGRRVCLAGPLGMCPRRESGVRIPGPHRASGRPSLDLARENRRRMVADAMVHKRTLVRK
jgi:hypothetical protein